MAVQLPYTVESFTQEQQGLFTTAVAEAADVQPFRVTINSISEAKANNRRLLAASIIVDFNIRAPPKKADALESISAGLSTDNLNANLASQGVQAIESIVKQAGVASGCKAGTYGGAGIPCETCPEKTDSSPGLFQFVTGLAECFAVDVHDSDPSRAPFF